ncbi:glucose 1-dehydrogenase [Terrarubrum flagellatum]|uniref:glucose 1-dehydrogenase n=1 Tax=Terrirubrum flagellatum TaxID=2895980 RepID=UPI003144FAF7
MAETTRKNLLITGGGRGIGAAIARKAARSGWNVMISYASNANAAAAVVADCEAAGAKAYAVKADAAKLDETESLFAQAREHFGFLDGFVNNAGVTGRMGRLENADPDHIREVIDINVTGVLLAARAAIPLMSTKHGGRGGAIVNMSSAGATLGMGNVFVWYAASKGAVDSMTIGLAQELADDGIRVNALAPGLIATDIHASGGDPERANKLAQMVPLKRVGAPEEMADVTLYLLSDAASYVTGHILRAAGGR